MSKKLRMDNVFEASYGYCEPYSKSEYRHSRELEKELSCYVVNNNLKTDLETLSKVAEILEQWNGQMVVVNSDKTITFYDGDY